MGEHRPRADSGRQHRRGHTVLEKALSLIPEPGQRPLLLRGVLRGGRAIRGAAERLQIALAQYPRDRVVRNQMGRMLFLQRKYTEP